MIKIISKITDKNAVREAKQKKSRGKSLKYVYKENTLVQMKQTNQRKS